MSDSWRPYDWGNGGMDDGTRKILATLREDRDEYLLQKKQIFEKFIAAYRGEHRELLGGDVPRQNHFGMSSREHCALLVSTQSSHFLTADGELTRYRYWTTSQDPSIEFRIGRKVHNPRMNQGEFEGMSALEITSDQLEAPILRQSIPEPSPASFRSALLDVIGMKLL
jgi:hypothetical protein